MIIFTASLLGLTALSYPLSGLRDRWLDISHDLAIQLYPHQPDTSILDRLVFIDIDDETLQQTGQWPWPRTIVADLLKEVMRQRPVAAGLDILLSEPDRFSPAELAKTLSVGQAAFIKTIPDGDKELTDIIAANPVVLAAALREDRNGSVLRPLRRFNAPSGIVNIPLSHDGVVRKAPVFFTSSPALPPSFATVLWQFEQQAQHTGNIVSKTLPPPVFRLYPLRADAVKTIPAYLFFTSSPPELPPHSILVIGSSAAGLKDHLTTPYHPALPASLLHLHLLYHLMSGEIIITPDMFFLAENLFLSLLITSLSMLMRYGSPRIFLSIGSILTILPAAVSALLFWSAGWLGNAVFMSVISLTVFMTYGGAISVLQARRKHLILNCFSAYLAPEIVQKLAAGRSLPEIKGEQRALTAMILDMRQFTHLSQYYENRPDKISDIINALFDYATTHIASHHGMVDKFMGDGILALWNVPLDCPDYPYQAVSAAQAIITGFEAWHERAVSQGIIPHNTALSIGIGIASGTAIVGHFGGAGRLNYSAIGSCINLAARLETHTKTLGCTLLTDKNTALSCPTGMLQSRGRHQLKGFAQKQEVFSLAKG